MAGDEKSIAATPFQSWRLSSLQDGAVCAIVTILCASAVIDNAARSCVEPVFLHASEIAAHEDLDDRSEISPVEQARSSRVRLSR